MIVDRWYLGVAFVAVGVVKLHRKKAMGEQEQQNGRDGGGSGAGTGTLLPMEVVPVGEKGAGSQLPVVVVVVLDPVGRQQKQQRQQQKLEGREGEQALEPPDEPRPKVQASMVEVPRY